MSMNSNAAASRDENTREYGPATVQQIRLFVLVAISFVQVWIIASMIQISLRHGLAVMIPYVAASAVCWLVTLSIMFRWRTPSAEVRLARIDAGTDDWHFGVYRKR